ncbi:O-acetylhomoserine/O-acetylserine sulfhydrylase-like pyridoxal-dependent enzyme [Aquamicrobium terrae]|uniref:O-acetylhomoserine/O-acetylserine sulfhydrylase-like pyridoxal-dependent enzyme n=1 Tax=Aquamicrobium terrae TaxID=1324945 RepID=A0ABV2N1K0_9HYPH
MHLETTAIHVGRGVDSSTGAVSIPLHTSTTFERDMERHVFQDGQ